MSTQENIWEAAKNGNTSRLCTLITEKADIDAKNGSGQTPLHIAARHGKNGFVQLLINAKATLNLKNADGWDPLHMAVFFGRVDVVQTLIARNSCVDVRTPDGSTPLHKAAHNSDTAVVKILIDANADIGLADRDGQTALDLAAMTRRHSSIARNTVDATELLRTATRDRAFSVSRDSVSSVERPLQSNNPLESPIKTGPTSPMYSLCAGYDC